LKIAKKNINQKVITTEKQGSNNIQEIRKENEFISTIITTSELKKEKEATNNDLFINIEQNIINEKEDNNIKNQNEKGLTYDPLDYFISRLNDSEEENIVVGSSGDFILHTKIFWDYDPVKMLFVGDEIKRDILKFEEESPKVDYSYRDYDALPQTLITEIRERENNQECAKCGAGLTKFFLSLGKLCNYTWSNYCDYCHQDRKSVIPSKMLLNWDFTEYPVCNDSFSFITSKFLGSYKCC